MKGRRAGMVTQDRGRHLKSATYTNVNFRIRDLAEDVAARGSPNTVARRDLGRYYRLLSHVRPQFDEDEAALLIEVLERVADHAVDVTFAGNLLWSLVEEYIVGMGRR
ncbi:MAG: hypothetical protein ACRDF1_06225, partial [bacterium]